MKYFFIFAVILFSLACGATTPDRFRSDTQPAPEVSTDAKTVAMVVTGDLNIRADHTEKSADIGDLFPGDIVTCSEIVPVGDGLWCKHEYGWSNARWLRAVQEKEAR